MGLSVAAAVEVLWQRSRRRGRLEGQPRQPWYLGCVSCVWSLTTFLLYTYTLSAGNAGTALVRS